MLRALCLPPRQLSLIWKGICVSLNEALEEGRGINIKGFGAFTFESTVKDVDHGSNGKGSAVTIRPRFIPSPELAAHLRRPPVHADCVAGGSVYHNGLRMSYLNPVPIAQGTYFSAKFVASAMDLLFRAISDLLMRGYNLRLDFDASCVFWVIDRVVKVTFTDSLKPSIAAIEKSYPLKSINASLPAVAHPLSAASISPVHAIINGKRVSRLSTLQRPNSSMLKDIKQRIERLHESSKDLCNIHGN